MSEAMAGFYGEIPRLSHLGSRVAKWLEAHGYKASAVAIQTGLDKRDAQRVVEGSCGPRAFDRLAQAFGWPFLEAVMAPVVGADPLTALENEIERERNEIAARESRLARLRSARSARGAVVDGGLRLVLEEDGSFRASARIGDRGVGEVEDR
jgi:hypothetical protein